MNFLQLLQTLEERLGHIHLPLRPRATSIHELFEGCGLHHELMVTLVRAIYTENHCHHIKDKVTVEASLRAIAPIRTAILHADHTDVDTYRFLETLVSHIHIVFGQNPSPRRAKPESEPGQILRFPLRHRQAH